MADVGEPGSPDEPIDVVTTVGELDAVVVLLREFLHRTAALRAVALFPDATSDDGAPALIDCARLGPIEITRGGRTVHMPHSIELDATPSGPIPGITQLPPFEVDAAAGTIASPLGGMEHHALAVLGLAELIGDGGVALATFQTNDPEAPLSITARIGDPLVVSLGENEYEMEPGWPGDVASSP
jgi:hypothetical protein